MARTPSTPPRTELLWPRQQLLQNLEAQIETGEEMDQVLRDPSDLSGIDELWPETPTSWHQRNVTILKQAFTTTDEADQYDGRLTSHSLDVANYRPGPPSPEEDFQATKDALAKRIRRLRDIAGRLDLYDEPPGASTTAVDVDGPAAPGPVFVVHGRDEATKSDVARTLEQLTGDPPVILHEQPDGGATIIEKFEHHAALAGAAVVILSPDDVGGLADGQLRPRARQNVILELGWFWGHLDRGRVIALLVDDVEKPSDMSGVLYIRMDSAGAWKTILARELRNAGLDADANKLRM